MIIHSNQTIQTFQPRHDISQARNNGQAESSNHVREHTNTESSTTRQQDLAEQNQINELRSRDREVRAHEMAHLSAAGSLSRGGPTFEFVVGPDGQRYAVAGEVQIDTSGVPGDPEATLQKAQQIQQAALAPAQPSAQDRSVAIAAAAMAAEAQAETASQQASDNDDETSFQRFTARVNDTYNAISEADTQRASSLIDLVA
ncbi:MAG: hypothetical protein H0V39_02860 [Nitrosomonas sp.]|nr:hypothetical protein [Nitrosomonas sp.]